MEVSGALYPHQVEIPTSNQTKMYFLKIASFVLPALVCAQGSIATAIDSGAKGPSAVAVSVPIENIVATPSTAFTKDGNAKIDHSALAAFAVNGTSPNNDVKLKSLSASADPELILCTDQNCGGICLSFDLSFTAEDECFASPLEFQIGRAHV